MAREPLRCTGLNDSSKEDQQSARKAHSDADQVANSEGTAIETQIPVEDVVHVNSSASSLEDISSSGASVAGHPGWRHPAEYGMEHDPLRLLNSPLPGAGSAAGYAQNGADAGRPPGPGHPVAPSTTPNGNGVLPISNGGETRSHEPRIHGPAIGIPPNHVPYYSAFLGNGNTQIPTPLEQNGPFPPSSQTPALNSQPGPPHHLQDAWCNWHRQYPPHYHSSNLSCTGAPYPGHYPTHFYAPPNYRPSLGPTPSGHQIEPSQQPYQTERPRKSQSRRQCSKKPEKKYRCETCSLAFERPSNLRVHCRSHTGEKPYPCTECHKRFPTQSNLTRHERRVHPEAYARNHPNATTTQLAAPLVPITNPNIQAPTQSYGGIGSLAGNSNPRPYNPALYTSQTPGMYHPQTLNCLASTSTPTTKENDDDAKKPEGDSEYDELLQEEKM